MKDNCEEFNMTLKHQTFTRPIRVGMNRVDPHQFVMWLKECPSLTASGDDCVEAVNMLLDTMRSQHVFLSSLADSELGPMMIEHKRVLSSVFA